MRFKQILTESERGRKIKDLANQINDLIDALNDAKVDANSIKPDLRDGVDCDLEWCQESLKFVKENIEVATKLRDELEDAIKELTPKED